MKSRITLRILLIALIYSIPSCVESSAKAKKNSSKNNKEIEVDLDFFPPDAAFQVGDILTVDSTAFHNTTRVQLERKISIKEVDKIRRYKSLYHVNSNDNCLVVINDFLNESNLHTRLNAQKSIVDKSCVSKKIPIPNFWNIEKPSNETRAHLYSNSEIFVLELKIGLVSSKINSRKSSMPDDIKHGVVGGIVLNMKDTSAIYFLQYW